MEDLEARAIRELLSVPNDAPMAGQPLSMSRRRFLQWVGTAGAGAAAAGAIAPWLREAAAFAAPPVGAHEGILVLIEMPGGNDGLNTLVPVGSARYAALRPTIRYRANETLDIGNGYGLNPRLVNLRSRWSAGTVAAVQGVGVPDSNLSHFDSMATWMRGWGGAGTASTGWIGRWLDTLPNAASEPLYAVTIGNSVPLHLQGRTTRASSVPEEIGGLFGTDRTDPADVRLFDAVANAARQPTGFGALADAFAYSEYQTLDLANRIKVAYTGWQPNTGIGRQLLLCARLINANLGVRVFNVMIDGFDTHTGQRQTQEQLLGDLDAALNWFFRNVKSSWLDRVAVMTFSEFGRRPEENDGGGTDHGTASVCLLAGNKVKGGRTGRAPSLTTLDQDGNLVMTTDFRSVYASVLKTWLNADPVAILGQSYPTLPLFTSGP